MQTKAAILYSTRDLRIETLNVPEPKAGQVLVEIAYSGVCHSQLLEFAGKRGVDPYLPHTLGHEGSGRVLKVGPSVQKVKPGDRVVLTWIKGEGSDVPATHYQSGGATINSGAISTFMRHALISENRVIPISEKMPLLEAALLGCMIPTGAGIVINTAKVKAGQSIAVFGIGGIGLGALTAASIAGASPIIAVDIHEPKLEFAKKAGATHVVNASRQNPLEEILKISPKGLDFAVEAAGKKVTMEMAFESVRPGGGLCVLAGNLPKGEKISIDPFELIRGKRILGTWGGETHPDRDIPHYVDLYLKKKLKLDGIVTHQFCLDEIHQALEALEAGKVGRAVIDFKAGD